MSARPSSPAQNMTEGNIASQILVFALPLLGSSLVQQLYNTVDLLYVGNALGKKAAAAVSASNMMVTCLVGLFGGIAVGCSVAAAQYYGAGDRKRVHRVMQTAAGLSLVGGIAIMLLGIAFAPAYIRLINTPAEIVGDAVSYLRIYFLSVLFMVIYNTGAGITRALGNGRATFLAQLFGGLVNVLMDGFFVLFLGMGVRGVAWATLFSQGVAALLMVSQLMKVDEDLRPDLRRIEIDRALMGEILRIGIPAGMQTLLIAVSNVYAQYHINNLGTDCIAAMAIYLKVELPIYFPIVAIGSAATTFVGQNIGAGKEERASRGTRVCLLLGLSLTVVTSSLLLLFGRYAISLFNRDPAVVAAGLRAIHTTFPFYFLYVILQVLGDSIRGRGDSRTPMLIIMANITVLRAAILYYVVPRVMDIRGVAVSYPITWFTCAVTMTVFYYLKVIRTKASRSLSE